MGKFHFLITFSLCRSHGCFRSPRILSDTRGKHAIKESSEMRLAIVKEKTVTVIINREGDNRDREGDNHES